MVTYSYDAFGNTLNSTDTSGISLSTINPYRYRGYRYDLETGFYYLQSRYYNPQIGRFISPDSINYLNPMSNSGENLYTYTANNPVNLIDPDGNFAISAIIIGLAFGFTGTMLTDLLDDGEVFNGSQDWKDYLGNTLAGGIGGLAGAFGLNMLGSVLFSAAGDSIGGLVSGDINSWESFARVFALSIGTSILSSGLSKVVSDAFGASQYRAIRAISSNNLKVNNYLKGLSGSYQKAGIKNVLKIGANSMDDFLKLLSRTSSNIIVSEIAGNTISTSFSIWL
ncbi:RHS repeat-associated core domain-containing protein [Paracholeplasma manati]|uniref:RHS repeat-associated core domain-containing protein n=1 Tax=Paracholeplasma manati TaxID=591373 RepID=UPI0024085891|nr:RHS repeat-associated core domain-containing protein [Paracholeplasma manati]MDG0889313.1 RHS repeat-associated core domain-containing protein [Paracholeplasma manati]